MNKLLSIVIPIYNSAKYLKECLESILCYNGNNIEVILIDDGSTDNSFEICSYYNKFDNRVLAFKKNNTGVSDTRNFGIGRACGKYIMFVDSDDILDSDWYEILGYLDEDDIYYYNSKINKNATKIQLIKYIIGNNEIETCIAGPFSKAFKKKFLIENKLEFNQDIIYGEDKLFNFNCLIASKSYKIINKTFYNYRYMIISTVKKYSERVFKSEETFYNEFYKSTISIDIKEKQKKEILEEINLITISVILNQISYIEKYSSAKSKFSFLNEKRYKNLINYKTKNRKYNIIFMLLKIKMYWLVFYIYKFRNYRKYKYNCKKNIEVFKKI